MSKASDRMRQNKRLGRMAERGLKRSTVIVHDKCKPALDALRGHLASPASADTLGQFVLFVDEHAKPVNVSQVKHLSPFRYPGGKTWLVPEVRRWIASLPYRPKKFIEPFAGGAIVGLTVAVENLADEVLLCELDPNVASVWQTILGESDLDFNWFCNKIINFIVEPVTVNSILEKKAKSTKEKAFQTIIRNRMQRGGILASGASLMKSGENGKGLSSRWYPETLVKRFEIIRLHKHKIKFSCEDAFDLIKRNSKLKENAWFVDPPYTAGGKSAGSRLYTHSTLDHVKLFSSMQKANGEFMMTYDHTEEVKLLAHHNGFKAKLMPMKNTHHEIINEILVFRA